MSDLSLTTLYAQATGLVQAVLLILLFCSVLCWAIIVEKAVVLAALRRQARSFQATPHGLAQALLASGGEEGEVRRDGESLSDRRDRIERAMRETLIECLTKAELRLSYLATIGSSAPFIGLFGTVWGIMHSFTAIAHANDTSLAVVAPGIAEALSTTAVGLLAAIPASIAYNKLAGDFAVLSRQYGLAVSRAARRLGDTP